MTLRARVPSISPGVVGKSLLRTLTGLLVGLAAPGRQDPRILWRPLMHRGFRRHAKTGSRRRPRL